MMFFGMDGLWTVMFFVILILAALPAIRRNDQDGEEKLSDRLLGFLMAPLWVGGLVFFYVNWIKFHANYLGEFLPPLVVMSGVGGAEVWQRIKALGLISSKAVVRWLVVTVQVVLVLLVMVVVTWAAFASIYVTYVHEHTGTFQQSSLREASVWAKQNIPRSQPIFTGAAIVPYLSGHQVALDIAHPRWYAYEFTRTDTHRLNTFLPSIEEMLTAYRRSEWFLLDKQTGFSFLMEYSEIEGGLEEDWVAVKGIENGSNTLTFYRRVNWDGQPNR
jgi:hypothetical protein